MAGLMTADSVSLKDSPPLFRTNIQQIATYVETASGAQTGEVTDAMRALGSSDSTVVHADYPPVQPPAAAVQAIEPLAESVGLRRLRMLAAFVALFLAGWKSVCFLLKLSGAQLTQI